MTEARRRAPATDGRIRRARAAAGGCALCCRALAAAQRPREAPAPGIRRIQRRVIGAAGADGNEDALCRWLAWNPPGRG